MAWYSAAWPFRKKVTVSASQVDADLTDFPVYVNLADGDILGASRPDMRDVLFTAADGTTKLPHELVKRTVVGVGAWSWFTNPRAVYHSGTYERTYVGSVSTSGSIVVTQYTHTTGDITQTTVTASLEADDHDHAALLVRPSDSKLVAFYSKHNADTSLRYAVSTNAEDATAWGSESTTTFSGRVTYANPIIVADDSNACYVFSRIEEGTGDFRWSYKRTTDYSTWGSEVEVWDGGATQSYMHVAKNGTGRIDFFASDGHPSTNGNTSLYHFYAAWDSGTSSLKWYNSGGTEQTLPMTPSNATLIYDGSGGQDGWNHQIAIDGSGYPRVLFQKRVSATGTGDMRIMFARWNGSAWTTPVEITAAGGYVYSSEPAYCGVSCFDGSDLNTVYLGKEVSGVYEIQKWVTSDTGATWSKDADITTGGVSGQPNFRPFSPLGHTGRLACLWTSGVYTSYTNYRMNIHCSPGLSREAHFKASSISGSVDTDFYVYYGNSASIDQEDRANTWDSNFMAVYHMEELPSSISQFDSTSNARHGTKRAMIEPAYKVDANIGNKSAQLFDGADDYITTPTGINLAGLSGATIEVVGSYDGSGASGDEHQFWSNWNATTASIMMRAEPTAGGNVLEIFAIKGTDTQVGGSIGGTVSINTLHHLAAVYDTTNLRGYIDGTVGGTTFATGGALDATASIAGQIGNTSHTTSEGLTGYVEEVRISQAARSAAWLKSTSINLKTPATFYTLGTEEMASAGGVTGTLSVTESGSDAAAISGAVLVQGALSVAENGADTAAFVGGVLVQGSFAASESGSDTSVVSGVVLVQGNFSTTESGSDTAAFVGEGATPAVSGSFAAAELGSDTASATGHIYIAGQLSAVEGGLDAFAVSGNIFVSGLFDATESGADTASFTGPVSATLTAADLAAIDALIVARLGDVATAVWAEILSGTAAGERLAAVASDVLAAASVTPIQADIRKVNNLAVDGAGTEADPWGPV